MSEDPEELWADTVPIDKRTPKDFQNRTKSFAIYDPDRIYRRLAERCGNRWECTPREAFDRALRIYLANCFDELETTNLRIKHKQTVLVPPPQWVTNNQDVAMHGDIKMPKPDPVENTNNRQFAPAAAKAVDKMVKILVNGYELYPTNDALGKAALCFVAQCDLPEDYDLLYDDEETPDSGSEDGIGFEVREQLMITAFFETKVLRNIIDYFLTSNIPEQGQNLSQIVEGVDVTRNSVSSQIDVLLRFDFLAEHGEGRIKRYMLNSDIEYTSIIAECNNKLGEV